jgi:hypothetical protein
VLCSRKIYSTARHAAFSYARTATAPVPSAALPYGSAICAPSVREPQPQAGLACTLGSDTLRVGPAGDVPPSVHRICLVVPVLLATQVREALRKNGVTVGS